ncbi:hypothetical protein [Rhizobium sp. BK538]|uniref:hypothetical protein n=1 Tax=Rhizobium sp. BK538 TaxID=2586984 RepID=UPI0016139C18|nr:hypothetical protein [Rhizobium sp. BK538]MBB4170426.1 hypothetical protein [Rhizobium sp. BK538]
MGLPNNYSLEVPERCLDLLTSLLPNVRQNSRQMDRYQGALTTTLTLALATPMLSLPIERIEKHLGLDEGYADDRHLAPELAKRVSEAIVNRRLSDYPAFAALDWHFLEGIPPFNMARGMPGVLARKLNTPEAATAAQEMGFQLFLRCLRNALSHGGIIYLDEHGEATAGEARMLCFVSARPERTRYICDKRDGPCPSHTPKNKDLRLLRVSEEHFQAFLHRWVAWLRDEKLRNLTAA